MWLLPHLAVLRLARVQTTESTSHGDYVQAMATPTDPGMPATSLLLSHAPDTGILSCPPRLLSPCHGSSYNVMSLVQIQVLSSVQHTQTSSPSCHSAHTLAVMTVSHYKCKPTYQIYSFAIQLIVIVVRCPDIKGKVMFT